VTPGRILAALVTLALASGTALMLFPSLLHSGKWRDFPMSTDPVIINAVKGRQSGLREMGTAVKNIDKSIKAGLVFDVELLADVQNMATNAEQMPFWFPPGSGEESGMETDALPEIWRSRERFDRLSQRLVRELDVLEAITKQKQQAEFVAQFQTLTEVCDECHEDYSRESDRI